ncbi:hypothetical protein BJY52DRAFT_403433 [Lactarius psammicola]|nr:hypothetical protein BJY52DRAFT_403433 [Lactarius psammicola]
MPVCPHPQCPCGHKNVPAEVLIGHVESSPWAALYFCGICRCVCKSESVLILHKQKVHKTGFAAVPSPKSQAASLGPPSSCRICSRVYSTVSALEQHYRDTPVHPKCTRCDIGFVDNAAIQAHVISTHRPITCNICNGLQVYGEDVAHHYKISPNHPSCPICDIGFKNKEAFDEHNNTKHPQFRCKTCNIPFGSVALLDAHYRESPRHPRCPECQLSFEDNLALVKHVIAIFNPLIKDSGRLILKTSQMSLHDAFSDASIITRSSRSPSPVCSFRGPSTRAVTPTRSVASPIPSLQRQSSVLTTTVNTAAASESSIPFGPPSVTSQLSPSSTSTPSLISRSATFSDQNIEQVASDERAELILDPKSAHMGVAASPQRPTPLSPPASISTRSIVAGASYRSDTVSPVSSAQSIFGRAASITSIPGEQTTTTVPHSDITLTHPVSLGEVSSTKGSMAGSARGRSPSRQSISSDFHKGGPGHSPRTASRASAKTVSLPPSHVVFPSPGQRERFRIAPANSTSRADSPAKSYDSGQFHLPRAEPPRQLSLTEDSPKATGEPRLTEKHPSSLAPGPTVGIEALNTSPQPAAILPPHERFVSHVYCRMCRRDPCRQPAATMCGHIFCYQCISSEVVKTSQCPVCEAPTLLYSIFRLHLA